MIQEASRHLSKEAYLWYTFTSPQYLDQALSSLGNLEVFLNDQAERHPVAKEFGPAVYWRSVIARLLETYANARAMLENGEFLAMRDWCLKVDDLGRGFREQGMWMDKEDFIRLLSIVDKPGSVGGRYTRSIEMLETFSSTSFVEGGRHWSEITSDQGFDGSSIALNFDHLSPASIPEYLADTSIVSRTGEIVPWTGTWVPVDGMGSAALAFARQGQVMQPKYPITHIDEDGFEHTEPVEAVWNPVKPTGRIIYLSDDDHSRRHMSVGTACPESGYWFTPAKQGSRHYFKHGDLFPNIENSAYGDTFWQWSPDQAGPRLHQ